MFILTIQHDNATQLTTHRFDKLKSDHDICKAVHTVLFNRAGKKTEIKKNVRKWSGVTTEDEDELEEVRD